MMAGSFSETATFGSGEANETTLTSVERWDIFIAKYYQGGPVSIPTVTPPITATPTVINPPTITPTS